jgi:predicted dienelactone hydrolase
VKPDDGIAPYPLVIFSHCLRCGRYSSFSLAERLASHGFVVLSADHAGALPFVPGARSERLLSEQLEVRVQDVIALIDAAVTGQLFMLEGDLERITIDADQIGVFGHSFGAATMGKAALADPRIVAVAGLAAPLANPLFPGVEMADITVPTLHVLAEEDNSILEFGNDFIRVGFSEANAPSWLVSIADAGHWSVSDMCGLTEAFDAGCGEGIRHSKGNEGDSFTYVAPEVGIAITQQYLSVSPSADGSQVPSSIGVEFQARSM